MRKVCRAFVCKVCRALLHKDDFLTKLERKVKVKEERELEMKLLRKRK